ncbi:hypothetical protein AM588_10007974 [Phytophthora nicotianae]|uniref:Tr-type G domain-containing protein n=1 Tax=Phytophthora nicotianae TaxID=4792 RepID=A0A0W8DML4_PHYNI|nr:hypothetical protein AM588_10007974 [Phytophthora nicotianae]
MLAVRRRALRALSAAPLRMRGLATASRDVNEGEVLTPKTVGPYMSERLEEFLPERIRNFSIVAHIDHGKSTLADRLLETSGNISRQERESAQFLDNLKVERERGITVKAQTASMVHRDPKTGETFMLNLVDTPGHVDFSYEVGYIIAGMKSTTEAKVGDTFFREGAASADLKALPGFQEARSMVFASMYPTDDSSFDELRVAIEKLTLNDASVTAQQETSGALGMASAVVSWGYYTWRCSTNGIQVMVTAPMVPYTVIDPKGKQFTVETPGAFPESTKYYDVLEPMVEASIITPASYLGPVLALAKEKRGIQTNLVYLEDERVIVTINVPWQEVVTNFYNELKTISSGYATLNYREIEPQKSDIVKVDLLINGKVLDALSFVCHRSRATPDGRALCQKLKRVIDRQQYEISIQAALGGKIFAKERIAPYRKDVLIKSGKTVGGGDSTRKKKLLAKQKQGKRRMRTVANVQLSQDAFWSVLSK